MNLPAKAATGDIMESVLIKGDLAKLSEGERVRYYGEVCKSIGVNPLTKPFDYITLNGKLQLYALRACTDQLRKINGISIEIVSRDVADGILTVHVRAKTPDGRTDEDLGSVAFPDTLKGEFRANMELKAVTKAKRRATLSICGLGWLDETEVEDIPSAAPGRKFINPSSRNVMQAAQQEGAGAEIAQKPLAQDLDDEIPDFATVTQQSAEGAADPSQINPVQPGGGDLKLQLLYSAARAAAMQGDARLQAFFKTRSKEEKEELRKIKAELMALYPK